VLQAVEYFVFMFQVITLCVTWSILCMSVIIIMLPTHT